MTTRPDSPDGQAVGQVVLRPLQRRVVRAGADGQNVVLGRWLLRGPPDQALFLNSVPAQSGDFLVPDRSGNWRVLDGEGSVHQGTTHRHLDPEEVEATGIRTMGSRLDDLVGAEAAWSQWLGVVPLVPDMAEAVKLRPLDHQIRKLLGPLEAVCRKPRAHLHVEVERVLLAKARRLPIKAASYLASHTEDWERPLILSVLPKRILSEVRQDQIDIYENRVVARLIENLVFYLDRRIRVIKKWLKVFQDKEDYSNAVGGTYLRQKRILKLWGEFSDANEDRKRAKATLEALAWLKYRLMGLMNSPLYRDVPRRTYVAPTLRTTNILAKDQNYRRVAELWRAWVEAGHAKTPTPADVNREAQELCRGFENFALLLVVRALDQLGYKIRPQDMDTPVRMSGRWELEGHGTTAVCTWEAAAGNVAIEMGGKRLVVVALPASLDAASSEAAKVLEQIIDAMEEVGTADRTTIVLYAGGSDEPGPSASSSVHTVGNDPRTELPARIGFLPVSPWDIGSVERVSRAIRWFSDSARFDAYPLRIEDVAPEARSVIDLKAAAAWLETGDGGTTFTIRRPPRDDEWDRLRLGPILGEAREAHQKAHADHEQVSNELNKAVRHGKGGKLNQEKKKAYQHAVSTEQRRTAIEQLREDLEKQIEKTRALLVCPACGKAADPVYDFEPRANGCFRCDCQGCKMCWEMRMCKNKHRYAVMRPGAYPVQHEDTARGWEDRVYGSDLLALPGRTVNGSWGFVCPRCGEVS